MIKEIGIGIGVAVLVFLGIQGVDLSPVLFAAALVGALAFVSGGRGTVRGVVAGPTNNEGTIQKVRFDDVGGQETAKRELREALEFIRDEDKVKHLGIRPLRGILLCGPPGTGKTLLAKATAATVSGVFVSIGGSEFVEMYAGVGSQRVRKLFQEARDKARKARKRNAVVFIDEIEIVAGKRGSNSSHHEYDQTLNQLLIEMDGLKAGEDVRVLVVGATNRIDILDPAILRPGRFDRIVQVELPDKEGRLSILGIHARNKPVADDVDLEQIAQDTFGFSGAHLESVANEAAIFAFRGGETRIKMEHFREAIDKVMMGERLDRRPSKEELERVAVHEVGHALASEWVRPGSVAAVTVTSRGSALGYMRQSPPRDTFLYTRAQLDDRIAVCIAGAVAEEKIFGSRSTGSSSDFREANRIARDIVVTGLSPLGIVCEENGSKEALSKAMGEIVDEQVCRVRELIDKQLKMITELVSTLLTEESISGDLLRSQMLQSDAA